MQILLDSLNLYKINVFRSVFEQQETCEEKALCQWKQGKCLNNRDVHNNVCNPPEFKVNPVCHAITKGVCPLQWQVRNFHK